MLNRIGGQRWGEGPIQRQVDDLKQYSKPIGLDDVQDAVNGALKGIRKEDAAMAGVLNEAIVKNVVMVMKEQGSFTLEGLEKTNDMVNLMQSGVGKLASSKIRDDKFQGDMQVMQLGTALLSKALVEWVNADRPELAQDEKMGLDTSKIRQAVKDEGMKPEDQEHVETMLTAFEAQHGSTISMRQISSFQDEISAGIDAAKAKAEARDGAGLSVDQSASDAKHQLVLQSLGAYRLTDFLQFSADSGDLNKLASQVKPGATQALAGAGE